MTTPRINNFRMGSYAALAVGLINLRYQTGESGNLSKSLVLVIPGAALLLLSLTDLGKKWLSVKSAGYIALAIGAVLVAYSFLV
jgi:hypothetical protein